MTAKSKHRYSTLVLIGSFVILLIGAVASVDSGDLDELCNTENSLFKRLNNVWACSVTHYAEGYYHNYSSPATVTIANPDTYYIIDNFTMDNIRGFTYGAGGLETNKNGTYKLNLELAGQGGNNGDYEIELFINETSQPDCATFFTGKGADHINALVTCIKNLTVGQNLTVRVKDLGNPSQNINYHQLNFNIFEIQ